MKIFAKMKLTMFVLFLGSQCFASNRILEQAHLNDNKRCVFGDTSPEDCANDQNEGLAIQCINQEEYDTLVKMNYYPLCAKRKGQQQLVGWCTCGCFDPNARLFSLKKSGDSQWNKIRDILSNEKENQLLSLSDDATLSNFQTEFRDIVRSTKGPEKKPLVFIHTSEGNTLGLTTEHAVLLWSGEMVAAKHLKVGQTLVSDFGTPIVLEKIEHKIIKEDVLNVLTTGKTHLSHMIFAEGMVVGDLAWQNSLQSELNAVAVREI